MNLRFTPLTEIIGAELATAINIPGLQHISVHVETCHGNGDTSGKIDFMVRERHCGVSLIINADGSFILWQPYPPLTTFWSDEEQEPWKVKTAIIEALGACVRAAG